MAFGCMVFSCSMNSVRLAAVIPVSWSTSVKNLKLVSISVNDKIFSALCCVNFSFLLGSVFCIFCLCLCAMFFVYFFVVSLCTNMCLMFGYGWLLRTIFIQGLA